MSAEPNGAYVPRWRPGAGAVGGGRSSGRRRKALVLGAAVLALAGAVAAWLLFPDPFPQPYFLGVWMEEYSDARLPPSPWSRQDRATLSSLPWRENNTFTSQTRALMVEELRNLARRKSGDPVVVYLSAFARATPANEVYLIPTDARLDRPGSWLPMEEVLRYLRECPSHHKLLLLDVMHPLVSPQGGVLANEVAGALTPVLDGALSQDKDLLVLCACSPGQVSLASEEMGHTVFGYYLNRGLRGRAEGRGPKGALDKRVTVQELADYVSKEVDRWAWRNRGARQTPVLHGAAAADFPLVSLAGPAPADDPPLEEAYPAWLRKEWERLDEWWTRGDFRAAPGAYEGLEAAVLRAERQWRVGHDPAKIQKNELGPQVERLDRQRRERVPAPDRSEPRSLAQAVARGQKPPDLANSDTLRDVRELAGLSARLNNQPKPNEADKKRLDSGVEQLLKKFEGKPFDLAWVVFESAADVPPTPDTLRFLADLLTRAKAPHYAETDFLQRLTEVSASPPVEGLADALQLALQAAREAERAAVAEPEALPWVQAPLTEAARQRREAEELLFARDAARRARARPALEKARNDYQTINAYLRTIQDAQQARDEALVLLPSYPLYLEAYPANERAWENATETALELRKVLSGPGEVAGVALADRVRKMADLTEALRKDPNNLRKLRQPFHNGEVRKLIGRRSQDDPADAMAISALLGMPWPMAALRVELWAAWRRLAGALHEKTLQTEGQRDDPLPEWEAARALEAGRRKALQRARWSLGVLRLLGADQLGPLEKALDQAARSPDDARAREALTKELRQAWDRVGRAR